MVGLKGGATGYNGPSVGGLSVPTRSAVDADALRFWAEPCVFIDQLGLAGRVA